MAELDFDDLLGKATYHTSLAYWIGTVTPPAVEPATLTGLAGFLAQQYDREDQADCYESLFPEDEEWPRYFTPVASIQLTRRWSPLPTMIQILGSPQHLLRFDESVGAIAVAAAWPPSQIPDPSIIPRFSEPDQERFAGILAVAAARGREARRGLFLVAEPGWSYDHNYTFSAAIQRIMKRASFCVLDRRPK